MTTNQGGFLRWMVVTMLGLLTIQYELGMVVNLSPNLPELAPFGFSLAKITDALRQAGSTAQGHALLGSLLALISTLTLVLSLRSRVRSAQIFGSLGFLSVILAATGGVLFVLSGFQEDRSSLAMASYFLLAFISYFLELYALKPTAGIHTE